MTLAAAHGDACAGGWAGPAASAAAAAPTAAGKRKAARQKTSKRAAKVPPCVRRRRGLPCTQFICPVFPAQNRRGALAGSSDEDEDEASDSPPSDVDDGNDAAAERTAPAAAAATLTPAALASLLAMVAAYVQDHAHAPAADVRASLAQALARLVRHYEAPPAVLVATLPALVPPPALAAAGHGAVTFALLVRARACATARPGPSANPLWLPPGRGSSACSWRRPSKLPSSRAPSRSWWPS